MAQFNIFTMNIKILRGDIYSISTKKSVSLDVMYIVSEISCSVSTQFPRTFWCLNFYCNNMEKIWKVVTVELYRSLWHENNPTDKEQHFNSVTGHHSFLKGNYLILFSEDKKQEMCIWGWCRKVRYFRKLILQGS